MHTQFKPLMRDGGIAAVLVLVMATRKRCVEAFSKLDAWDACGTKGLNFRFDVTNLILRTFFRMIDYNTFERFKNS
jgi:hypothetical protein